MDHEEEEEDLSHDVSQEVNNSVESSYWETLSADYFLGWLDCYELLSFRENICCVTIIEFWNFGADDQYKKKQTCSRSGCFFWSDYLFLIFKDRLLNALLLFNKYAIECFLHGSLYSYFSYSTAVSSSVNQISSWNYIT